MSETFNVRRDSSTNNVPTVGYNDGVDAQDVLLYGASKFVETLTTDGAGRITLSHNPVSLSGTTFVDASGIRRGRNLNDDITIATIGGTTLYAGSISAIDKTLKVYTDVNRTAVISGGQVTVTYYVRVPIKINSIGELSVEKDTSTKNVNIKSSDVPFERTKGNVLLKKEISLAAGASANALDIVVGNSTKDIYLTNAVAYYDGTGTETDPYLSFWFDVADASNASTYSIMDLPLPPKTKAPMQIDFGPVGLKIPAGSKLRFRVNANFTTNKIHAMAFGYQYLD